MEKKTLLITGGMGYIGTNTCLILQQKYNIVTIDIVDRNIDCNIIHYCGNICDKNMVEKVFEENKIDIVLHFASLKSVSESTFKPLLYYNNNINGILTLLTVMEQYNCTKLIFSSSATVYGDSTSPMSENSKIGNTTNPYGTTKYICEQILDDYCKYNSNMSVIKLRYFNPVGIPDNGVHERTTFPAENLVPNIIYAILKDDFTLQIYGHDYDTVDGTCERDFIHLEDLIIGHEKAIEYLETFIGIETFNLGTGKPVTVLQLINAFERCLGVSVPYVLKDRRNGDIQTSYCDTSKSLKILNWKTEKSIDDICYSYSVCVQI